MQPRGQIAPAVGHQQMREFNDTYFIRPAPPLDFAVEAVREVGPAMCERVLARLACVM